MRYLLFVLALMASVSAATVTYAGPGNKEGPHDPDCGEGHAVSSLVGDEC
jgi:hypothetical protein